MGQKKDIGQFFENKLNDGKSTPNKHLWDKINTSLDEEKRRKKRMFFYWFVGGGASVILGFALLFGIGFFKNTESFAPKEKTPVVEDLDSKSKKDSEEIIFDTSEKDSLGIHKRQEEKLSKINSSTESVKKLETESSSEKNYNKKINSFSTTKKPVDETFSVAEKYYYYNSRNGKQIVTENRKEIDSIVLEAYRKIDSTGFKMKDSLK